MTRPRVSVCIPTYNGEQHLAETLDSVFAQTFDNFEVVVADDCSTDKSVDTVSRYGDRIRVLRSERTLGPVANWNRVIAESTGEQVKLMHQDDRLRPHCLERQVDALDKHPGAAVVACRRTIIDGDGRTLLANRGWGGAKGEVDAATVRRALVRAGTNLLGEPSAILFRRSAFDAARGFTDGRSYTVDIDLWVRLLDYGTLVYLPEPLCDFRVTTTSWSARLSRRQAAEGRAWVRELARGSNDASGTDVASGLAGATALAWGRRLLYRAARVRASMQS